MTRFEKNEAAVVADNEEKTETFVSFEKELHDLATKAFWYIKKMVDEKGIIRPEAKYVGQTLEWDDCDRFPYRGNGIRGEVSMYSDDCDRFPYVGIGIRGEVFMYSDDWNVCTAQDSDILNIAIKLQSQDKNK